MDVPQFYSGTSVFITGGTGFVGLCLIEKLLRCVPDIRLIYVLIRCKHNKALHIRLNELVKNRVFNSLRNQRGVAPFQKIHGVLGNISEDKLQLSLEDEAMLIQNVNVVFHCAACLDFNESLRNAININLLGTRRVVELCKKMVNLKALVHVSSAYVNANRKLVKETMYPFHTDCDKIIKLIENLDDTTINRVMSTLLQDIPNCYTFTKGLAEYEVISVEGLFPTVIVRPSMITGAWKEPVPGWTSSRNGPQGFLMAAAKGVVRRLPVNKYIVYDYIPVDIVVNEIISSAWYVVKNKPQETLILHCTTSTCNPFKWLDIEGFIPELLHNYPSINAVWYPTLKLVPSMSLFRISAFIFHMIPAYILDLLTSLYGRKPILVKLHKNINKSLDTLIPFIFTEWKFDNSKTLMLHQSLSPSDQQKFGVDVKDLTWKPYFNNLALGVRQYLNNENINNLDAAKKKNTYLWVFNIGVQIFVIYALFFMVCAFSGSIWYMSLWCLPVIVFFLYYL